MQKEMLNKTNWASIMIWIMTSKLRTMAIAMTWSSIMSFNIWIFTQVPRRQIACQHLQSQLLSPHVAFNVEEKRHEK